jgi:hypothetical protein
MKISSQLENNFDYCSAKGEKNFGIIRLRRIAIRPGKRAAIL